MEFKIQTERILIRPARLNDSDFFLKLLNQKSYIENIRDSGVRTTLDAEDFIQKSYLNSYSQNGFGLYVLTNHLDNKAFGVCGFVKRETLPIPDFGFAILDSYSRQGFILEASQSLLSFAQTELKWETIAAITSETNLKSQNVLSKLGFQFLKKMQIGENSKESLYYELNLKDYL